LDEKIGPTSENPENTARSKGFTASKEEKKKKKNIKPRKGKKGKKKKKKGEIPAAQLNSG